MATTTDRFPKGTPLFGRCIGCNNILAYPPIQVPITVIPSEIKGKYNIKFDYYCLKCAVKIIKRLKENDITPTQCWDIGQLQLVDNPYRSK